MMLSPLAGKIQRETCPFYGSLRKAGIFWALSECRQRPIKGLWEDSSPLPWAGFFPECLYAI